MPRTYRHVLIASDLSDVAATGALRAAKIAGAFRARLSLLHVVGHFPEDLPNDLIPPEDVDPAQFFVQHALQRLRQLARQIGRPRARIKVVLSPGSTAHAIVQCAQEIGVDLIVLDSAGHHVAAQLFGSTVTSIVNASSCDVLTVRTGVSAAANKH